MQPSSRLIAGTLAALILVFGLRCYRTYRVFNDTTDEAIHISGGLEVSAELLEHSRPEASIRFDPSKVVLVLNRHRPIHVRPSGCQILLENEDYVLARPAPCPP